MNDIGIAICDFFLTLFHRYSTEQKHAIRNEVKPTCLLTYLSISLKWNLILSNIKTKRVFDTFVSLIIWIAMSSSFTAVLSQMGNISSRHLYSYSHVINTKRLTFRRTCVKLTKQVTVKKNYAIRVNEFTACVSDSIIN